MKRTLRLLAGLFVLTAASVILSPHAFNFVSRSAVVNAPIISIKSPFEGLLISTPRRPGQAVPPSEPIVEVTASMTTTAELARLEARVRAVNDERKAILEEISALETLDANLLTRAQQVSALAGDVLRYRRDGLRSQRQALEELALFLEAEAERVVQLAKSGTVTSAHLQEAASQARAARAEIGALTAQLGQVTRELQAIEQGLLPAFGSEDGSYALQRRDEVAIRLADLRTRAASLAAQSQSTKFEIDALRTELARLDWFAPRFDHGAVVWTASPAAGSAVATGDEILQVLDCSRRFLEVKVPESASSRISIGDRAWVRLSGSDKVFWAEVESLRGAGSQPETGRLAARPVEVEAGSLSVMLLLAPLDVTASTAARRYCEVGRTAEVRFDRGWQGPLRTRIEDLTVVVQTAWQTAGIQFGVGKERAP